MRAAEALIKFLSGALIDKKERYIGFASKPKTQSKFLATICHELEVVLDSDKRVESLPDAVLAMPGWKFEPNGSFGLSVDSLKGAINEHDESFLIISENGQYAIYGPETFIDDRAYYAL